MPDAPAAANTAGVIVTYNPDAALPERVSKLAELVDRVLVLDNASNPASLTIVRPLQTVSKVELQLNDRNLGVAAALNQGAVWARDRGYSWVLLLDQDTLLAREALTTLQEAWRAYPERQRVAVIGCNFLDPNVRRLQYPIPPNGGPPWSEQKTVITAGSLLSLAAFEVVGPLREEFFIDHVDHEYCLRAWAKGFRVLATRRPVMEHTVGAGRVHEAFGFVTYNHSPERWYFMLRNESTLVREYLLREPRWVVITMVSRVRSVLLMLLFEEHRGAKLRNALAGLRDGLRGRFGRATP